MYQILPALFLSYQDKNEFNIYNMTIMTIMTMSQTFPIMSLRFTKLRVLFYGDHRDIKIQCFLHYITKYPIKCALHFIEDGSSCLYLQSTKQMVSNCIYLQINPHYKIKHISRFHFSSSDMLPLETFGVFLKAGRKKMLVSKKNDLCCFGNENVSHISSTAIENVVHESINDNDRSIHIIVKICGLIWEYPYNMNIKISPKRGRLQAKTDCKWECFNKNTLMNMIYFNSKNKIQHILDFFQLNETTRSILYDIISEKFYPIHDVDEYRNKMYKHIMNQLEISYQKSSIFNTHLEFK